MTGPTASVGQKHFFEMIGAVFVAFGILYQIDILIDEAFSPAEQEGDLARLEAAAVELGAASEGADVVS